MEHNHQFNLLSNEKEILFKVNISSFLFILNLLNFIGIISEVNLFRLLQLNLYKILVFFPFFRGVFT